jgi:capsule polysaccharide export protein KpsE/RkpR
VVIKEITSVKPLTPQQSRIAALKTQKDSISKQLKTERDRQKITKAQQQLAKVQSSIL